MDFIKILTILTKITSNKKVGTFVQKYGIFTLSTIIGFVVEAEKIFKKPGQGKEKLLFVLNKTKEVLVNAEALESGEQIPDWITAVVTEIISIVNKFVK